MSRSGSVLLLLASASMASFAVANVNNLPLIRPHVAQHAPETQEPHEQIEIAYAGESTSASNPESAVPETVLATDRQPLRENMPATDYGDASNEHLRWVGQAPIAELGLPTTHYGGEENNASGLPETVLASAATHAVAGLPETVYGAPVARPTGHESQNHESQNPESQNPESQSLAEDDATPASAATTKAASPYSHFTQAEQAGMNPCLGHQGTSPYSSLTDAQRAAQTNCN